MIFNSLLLGVGLAMDAFSVSLANGLAEPQMKKQKSAAIAATFALFQGAMPLLGWLAVHTVLEYFTTFHRFIPWIALVLLLFLGGKMLLEAKQASRQEETQKILSPGTLLLQGVATSIDALSVGFTIADYDAAAAVLAAALIAAVTGGICLLGVALGKRFGTRFAGGAQILGGVILILIGLEIFIKGVFFA